MEKSELPDDSSKIFPPQRALSDMLRWLTEKGYPGHFVTLNPGGSPHMTLIWIMLDGDDVVAVHLPENRMPKNIRRYPLVAISLFGAILAACP